jgi:hypothetical protein
VISRGAETKVKKLACWLEVEYVSQHWAQNYWVLVGQSVPHIRYARGRALLVSQELLRIQ